MISIEILAYFCGIFIHLITQICN